MLIHGFLPYIVLLSRMTDQTAKLIDHVFIKERVPSVGIISGNIFTDLTNHFANFLFIPHINATTSNQKQIKTPIFSSKNTDKFLHILKNASWNLVHDKNDVTKCTEAFYNIVQKAYEKAFP